MKTFSAACMAVYRVGSDDACSSDGTDRTVFCNESRQQHHFFLIHTGTLCQIFYRSGFLINPLAFHTDCGEDNRFMSASRLSDRILYSKKQQKKYRIY